MSMKKQYNGKKLRYGGISLTLTVVFIAVVILCNVIFSALSSRYLWYIDMTPESIYTVSDDCFDLLRTEAIKSVDDAREFNRGYNSALRGEPAPDGYTEEENLSESQFIKGYRSGLNGGKTTLPGTSGSETRAESETEAESSSEETGFRDENGKIRILFLDEIDNLMESTSQRYIYQTARELENEFRDYIEIECINIWKNPTAVAKYKTSTNSSILSSYVIIEFGSEFRIYASNVFYVANDANSAPWAYNGEKKFAAAILAVTRSESPVCLIDMAHGEAFYDTELLSLLQDAGFIIASTEETLSEKVISEVEEACNGEVRLILIYNPTSDFLVAEPGVSDIDEIKVLDDFLDDTNSMMVFMSPTSPVLPNLEEYLTEWGIVFERATDASGTHSYMIKDSMNSLTTDGFSVVGEYVSTGLGESMTSDMQKVTYPKKVIFRNAMSIRYSDLYRVATYDPSDLENPTEDEIYQFGDYYSNGVSRSIYDVFLSSPTAEAMANGKTVQSATDGDRFRLMTISCEYRTEQESNYTTVDKNSYVLACGSTEFARQSYLQSAVYGNTDLLLTTLRAIGREPVPVGITFKPFADSTIDSITTAESTAWTVWLAVIPAAVCLVSGIVVLVKRKYA